MTHPHDSTHPLSPHPASHPLFIHPALASHSALAAAWMAAHPCMQVPPRAVAWCYGTCCRQEVTCICVTSRVARHEIGPSRVTANQSWEVLELLQWCWTHMSALVQSGELAPSVSLSQLQASSGHSLCGSLPSLRLV